MPSRFQRIFPNNGKLTFDGGLNNKFNRQHIENNESPDCANVVFGNGSVETREGFQKLNTTAVGSHAGDGIFTRRDQDGAETMVVFAGSLMYDLAGTTFTTVPSAQSVFTAGTKVFGAMQENYLFLGNGDAIPYKWNGAEFTRHGVYPTTETMTAATASNGTLTGDYQYALTGVNSNLVESDLSPLTATFTAASEAVDVTSIPVFPQSFGVNTRKLYRTEAGGTSFKLLTTLSDNVTTTYEDNSSDSELGATAPDDQGVPPSYSAILYHQNRLFMLDPTNANYLWYTDLNNPYVVGALNFIRIGNNTNDLTKSLGIWQDSVVVYGEQYAYLVYMPDTDPANWQTTKTASQYGCKSPRCVLEIENKSFFAAAENDQFAGFSEISGLSVARSTTFLTNNAVGSDRVSDRVEPDMFKVQSDGIENIAGIVHKKKAWITLQYDVGSSENNRIYQVDFSRTNLSKNQEYSWVPFTSDVQVADFTVYNGEVHGISSLADGFIYQMTGTGVYNDDGAAIDSYLWTKEFSGFDNEADFTKDFRYAKLLIGKLGGWFMTVRYRTDSDKGDGDSQNVDLDPGSSLWNTFVWGTDTWGGGSDEENYKMFLRGKRGDRIQFKFTNQNTADQRFRVLYMDFVYNRKGFR